MEKIKLYVNISHAYVAESVDMFFIVFTRNLIIAAGKLFLKWNHYWSVGGPFSTLVKPNLLSEQLQTYTFCHVLNNCFEKNKE